MPSAIHSISTGTNANAQQTLAFIMPASNRFDPLDSRQLLTAVTLARTRSFTEAAKELGLTQSAVSHSLKSLETQLGQSIFERNGRQVRPTHNGEYFLREAMEILHRMQNIRERLAQQDTWSGGRIRVGAEPSCAYILLPQVLREFKQSFPRCSITIKPDSQEANLEALGHGELDVVLALTPTENTPTCQSLDWFTDELAVIMPPFHPLAQKGRLLPNDFQGESIHLLGNDHSTDSLVKSYFTENGIRALEFLYAGSVEVIKEMVKLGQGLAFLPSWTARTDAAEGSLVILPLGAEPLSRKWSIFHSDRQLNLHEETFIGLCLDAESAISENQVLCY